MHSPSVSSFRAALLFLAAAVPVLARETVLEDSPARLVVEVEVPAYAAEAALGGQRITAEGFGQASRAAGAPELPAYVFQVATGARNPGVSVEPLEWTELAVPQGLAGSPRWITSREPEAYKDPALFAAAAGISPRVSELRLYRGYGLRGISLPLGTYAEGSGRVRLLKKFRVTVTFPGPASAPAAGVRTWLLEADVKNPNGGQYLLASPRRAALRRAAASTAFGAGTPLLKIKVGDRQMDGFEEDGVYALTYETIRAATSGLSEAKSINGVKRYNLHLYAGPKDTLTTRLDSMVAPTLREIPIVVEDNNNDTTFNEGDRILFYGQGTSIWKPLGGAAGPVQWEFKSDPWSYENYYYLDWNTATGTALRLDSTAFIPAGTPVTAAPHYLRGEKDLATGTCDPANAFDGETGYNWYWFSRLYCTSTEGPVTWLGSQLRSPAVDTLPGRASDTVRIGFFGYRTVPADDYRVTSGGVTLPYSGEGVPGSWYLKTSGYPGNQLNLDSVRWQAASSPRSYRFEGYTVRYLRSLAWTGKNRLIFPAATNQRVAYRIDSIAAGVRVLRLEGGVARRFLLPQTAGLAATFSDSVGDNEDVQYFVYRTPMTVAPSSLTLEAVPTAAGVVQNLYTGEGGAPDPEYLIIAPQALLAEAVQLRNYRDDAARNPPLATAVVRVEDIYREWSGGRLSPPAIRDYLRWTLNRRGGVGTPGRLKYVLLYGDGHYDYRNLRNGSANTPQVNHIPPFNWDFNDGNPASTDDFFAVLDSGESWSYGSSLDLSVGRLPVKSPGDGHNYLEKIRRYEDPATAGEWRGRILLTSDDATQRRNEGGRDDIVDHVRQAEDLGNAALAQEPGLKLDKVYLFDYIHNASFLKPEATEDLINNLNRGTLYFTFYGHGAYNQMADEVLLKTNDGLARMKNTDKNFSMAIFSCTVGRFDKLVDEGMTEAFVRQKDIGAVVGLASSRESFTDQNEQLGKAFTARLFSMDSNALRGIGDQARLAKNMNADLSNNDAKYILLGEPVTVVHRPGLGLRLDSVPNTLQALGCGTIKGRVSKGSGKGHVSVRIVSGDILKTYPTWNGDQHAFKRGQILFEQTMAYQDSAFSMDYFLPKQVPFGDTAAKIQVFAWDAEQPLESSALIANLKISGTGNCVADSDGRGPRITVTGCNTRESGGVDFSDKVKIALPYCLQITVTDSIGGVLAGDGPDEGTTVEVVGSVAPFHPQAGVDDLYSKTYQLTLSKQDMVEGTHLLKVSARDGFGNLGQRQISLQVSQDSALRFIKAFNVPNPMKRNGTTFYFQTTLPSEEGQDLTSPNVNRIHFDLRIFNQLGYMVQEFRDARSGETHWDGKDAWGHTLANGVYFFQVTGTWAETDGSPSGGRQVSKKNVLVISR